MKYLVLSQSKRQRAPHPQREIPEGTIGALRNFDDAEKLSIVPQEVQVTSLILDIKLVNQLDLNEVEDERGCSARTDSVCRRQIKRVGVPRMNL